MTRHTFPQNNFTAGKLGKQVHARTDVDDYKNGVDELINFVPYRSGGIRLRPGIRVVERIEVQDTIDEMVQFQIQSGGKFYTLVVTQADSGSPFYVAEEDIYDNRVHKGKHLLGSTTDYYQRVLSLNALLNFPQQTSRFTGAVTSPDPDTWHLLEAQERYVLVNTTGLFEPLILLRYDNAGTVEWRITEYTNGKLVLNTQLSAHAAYALGYPYEKNRDSTFQLFRIGTTPLNVFQVQGPPGYFDAGFADSFIRVVPPGKTNECTFYIRSFDGGDLITVEAIVGNQSDWDLVTPTGAWSYSDWNHNDGWPKIVNSYNQRVVFANSNRFPNRLWFSAQLDSFILTLSKLVQDQTNDNSGLGYFGDISDAFAFSMVIASNDLLEITWMSGQTSLLVGTRTGEFRVSGDDGTFGPLTKNAILQTHHGSRLIPPQAADRAVLFVSKDGLDIKQLGFSNDAKAFVVRNLSTLVRGIVSESKSSGNAVDIFIKKIVWIAEDYTCWILLTNGKLIGFVKEDVWQVLAWYEFQSNPDMFIEDIKEFEQVNLAKSELRIIARSENTHEFYSAVITQDYKDDASVFYPNVSNEHPQQYRYLDYNTVDVSDAVLNVDVGDYSVINGVYAIRGTGVVHDLERLTYNGPTWGTILNGDIIYAITNTTNSSGEITSILLGTSLQNAIDSIQTIPPAPTGAGTLTGAGFEAIVDRFDLSDFNKEVTILGAPTLAFQHIGEFAWDLDQPTRPIVELGGIFNVVNYGYRYRGFIKSLNFESQPIGQYADKQVMFKRIDRVLFKVNRTFNCDVGSSDENMYPMEFPVEFTRNDLSFYDGDVVMDWDASAGEQQRVQIEVEGHGPVGILGLFIRGFMGET